MVPIPELIGVSPGIRAVRESVGRLVAHHGGSHRLPPVLIQGETGTGKGLLAHALHRASRRAAGPFVSVNCAAIPVTLLEAEMFGFERGAFTDARQAKPGLFQAAHHGAIFLDEVALLPEELQSKLLKALEDREVRRLGAIRSEPVDVWIIAATSEDLVSARRERRFHEALYHRLSVVTFSLPPLRERGDDIMPLTRHFLSTVCADYGLPPKTLAADVPEILLAHSWPGNVRELANAVERAALLSEATVVTAASFGLPPTQGPAASAPPEKTSRATLEETVESVERDHILAALAETSWNISRAAARLGVPRNTLYYRIARLGIRRGRVSPPIAAPPEPVAPLSRQHAPGASASPRWERCHIAFLKVSFTAAMDMAIDKVRSFGGRIEELAPSSLVAVFGIGPVEDGAIAAAHAALAVLKISERLSHEDGVPGVTIGIHAAHLLAARSAHEFHVSINLDDKTAAFGALDRLIEHGQPNVIYASAGAAPFLDRRFVLEPLAPTTAAPTYRLVRLAPMGFARGRRGLTPFVGRDVALGVLRQALEQMREGAGRVVGVVGEPGVGKSRLLHEFRQSLGGTPVLYLEARCLSHAGAIPYAPLLDVVRQTCGLDEGDSSRVAAHKVRGALERIGADPEVWTPYVRELLSGHDGADGLATLSPAAIKARTFELVRGMILGGGRQPIVLVIEDLQWIDTTSEEFLALLVDAAAGTQLLFVCTYRPGYRAPWMERSYASQLTLAPLSAADSRTIVDFILPAPLAMPAAAPILEKAEGNPFFLEELALGVAEQSAASPLVIPETVQGVLLARMNRLPLETRRLLQTAAVLGREFSLVLLTAVASPAADVEGYLRELQRLEFIHAQPTAKEAVYRFKHALTHDVAYASLLSPDRAAIHAMAGRALEELYADRLAEVLDRLAHHFARTEEHDKAFEYLVAFADKAAAGYAHADALTALQEAVHHVEALPPPTRDRNRIELILRQAHSLYLTGGLGTTLDLLRQHVTSLDRVGDPSVAGRYYFWLGHTLSSVGGDQAQEYADRAIQEAQRAGDTATVGKAFYVLARVGFWSCRFADGIAHGRRAISLLKEVKDQWWLGHTYCYVSGMLALTGDLDAAERAADEARAIGLATGDPRLQSFADWTAGTVYAAYGDGERAVAVCRRGLAVAPDPINSAGAQGTLGWAYREQGDLEQATSFLRAAVEQFERVRFRPFQAHFTGHLAEAYVIAGQLDRAAEVGRDGLRLAAEAKFSYAAGLCEHALGRVAHALGNLVDAQRHLDSATEIFASIGSRYDVARVDCARAALAYARGDEELTRERLAAARDVFAALAVPRQLARVEELAAALFSS
jgi:DNA-binding NtrC family response regulator/tetratricopeptide (TPR) repeat protein